MHPDWPAAARSAGTERISFLRDFFAFCEEDFEKIKEI
jgi:hypothetical protein